MGRLILHIGTHKTGTTSIQKSLNAQRARLRELGIHYPDYSVIGLRSHYAHIGVANGLAGDHPQITPTSAEAFFDAIRRQAENYDVTLVSAEAMYRQTIGDVAPQEAPSEKAYWAMRDGYIRRLRAVTGPADVVMVVRRQSDFAESMYQEHVKVTRFRGDFARYLREFWFHFRYYEQYLAWLCHFDSVKVVPFDAIKGEDIADRFLQAVGLPPGLLSPTPMHNVGMPHDAVILKRELNRTSLGRDQLNRLSAAMSGGRFRSLIRPGRRSFFASAEARAEFQARFAEGNEELARRAGHADGSLFGPIDATDGTSFGDTLPPEECARLAAGLAPDFFDDMGIEAVLRHLGDEVVPVEITRTPPTGAGRRKRRRAAV